MNTILFVGEHPKTYDVRWHTHEHWELVYCTSGKGAFRFENGMVMTYQAGEVVVIPPMKSMPIPVRRVLQTSTSRWQIPLSPTRPLSGSRMMKRGM